MENQHREIKGYRELDEDEVYLINQLKTQAAEVGQVIDNMQADARFDQRSAALARTNLQQGFMWAIRAVAQPTTFG